MAKVKRRQLSFFQTGITKWLLAAGLVLVLLMVVSVGARLLVVGLGVSEDVPEESEGDLVFDYAVGDRIWLGNEMVMTVDSVERSQGSASFAPPEGKEWVNVKVTLENLATPDDILGTYEKVLVDGQGNSYHYAETDKTSGAPDISNANFDQPITGGVKRTGWLGYEVPRDVTGLKFTYPISHSGKSLIVVPL